MHRQLGYFFFAAIVKRKKINKNNGAIFPVKRLFESQAACRAAHQRVDRNKGTWRDIRSALIIFAHSLLLTGDSAGGFPSAFSLSGSACALNEAKRSLRRASAAHSPSAWARSNMLDQFGLSDEKPRDVLDSSP